MNGGHSQLGGRGNFYGGEMAAIAGQVYILSDWQHSGTLPEI